MADIQPFYSTSRVRHAVREDDGCHDDCHDGCHVAILIVNGLVQLVMGCAMAPLSIAFVTALNALHTLLFIPVDFFKAFHAVAATPYLGLNVKILALLLLPLPLVMKAMVIIIGSMLCSLWAAAAVLCGRGSTARLCGCGIVCGILEASCGIVCDAFDWNRHSFPSYWAELRVARHYVQGPDGTMVEKPFEIGVIEIFIGLIVACIGLAVCVPAYAVIGAFKCVFGIIYRIYSWWCSYLAAFLSCGPDGPCGEFGGLFCGLFCAPFFIAAHVFIPAAAVLIYFCWCCYSVVDGVGCGVAAHTHGSPVAGVRHAFRQVVLFDIDTNRQAFDIETNSFCCDENCCDEDNPRPASPPRGRHWLDGRVLDGTARVDGGGGGRRSCRGGDGGGRVERAVIVANEEEQGAVLETHPAAEQPSYAAVEQAAAGDNDASPPLERPSQARLLRRFTAHAGLDNLRNRLVALDEIWTSFFKAAGRASEDAVAQGWVTRADFADCGAVLFSVSLCVCFCDASPIADRGTRG